MKRLGLLPAGVLLLISLPAAGQQLEPRAYSPAPIGLNFLVVPYVYSTGSVVTDPSLPVTDVSAKINAVALFYSRTFGFLGHSASAALTLPYYWGTVTGQIHEQFASTSRSGIGDMTLRLFCNILGGPALTPQEFAQHKPETALGASFIVSMPTGQYYDNKLINIGTNRWAFKPEIGVSHPAGRWTLEAYVGAWFYTANTSFYPGGIERSQNPILAVQGHVGYNFLPGLWLAVDGTWYSGGRTTTAGKVDDDNLSNTRIGATLAVPITRSQSVKLSVARGATTRLGQDFTQYGLAYQLRWF